MEFKDIKFNEFKTYKTSKLVKLALLKDVTIRDGETPSIPAENAIASEEVLILWMTNLKQGDRLGMIRFGSETDLHFPTNTYEVLIKEGSKVKAGISQIARRNLE